MSNLRSTLKAIALAPLRFLRFCAVRKTAKGQLIEDSSLLVLSLIWVIAHALHRDFGFGFWIWLFNVSIFGTGIAMGIEYPSEEQE